MHLLPTKNFPGLGKVWMFKIEAQQKLIKLSIELIESSLIQIEEKKH